MPIRSGAMQRPRGCRCGNTLRQRYDEVGLPCSSTMGSPAPTSTYAISRPRTRRRCFWYGNAAEIMLASPSFFVVADHRPFGLFFLRGDYLREFPKEYLIESQYLHLCRCKTALFTLSPSPHKWRKLTLLPW